MKWKCYLLQWHILLSNMWHFMINWDHMPCNLFFITLSKFQLSNFGQNTWKLQLEGAVPQSKSDTEYDVWFVEIIHKSHTIQSNFKHTIQITSRKLNITKDARRILRFGCNYFFQYKLLCQVHFPSKSYLTNLVTSVTSCFIYTCILLCVESQILACTKRVICDFDPKTSPQYQKMPHTQ